MIEFTTGVVFLLSSMYGSGAATAVAIASTQSGTDTAPNITFMKVILQDRKAVEEYLREQYSDTPILVEIARCESTFSQFDKNGKALRGKVDNDDIGVMQINTRYHGKTAEKLGFDIHTIEGNVSYAKHLYEKQGSKPWNASAKCWSKAV
ncbi:MAG: hypothetical protein Q8Q03_00780 [bacterium]|nr:hypothetical protein [bacterium]